MVLLGSGEVCWGKVYGVEGLEGDSSSSWRAQSGCIDFM